MLFFSRNDRKRDNGIEKGFCFFLFSVFCDVFDRMIADGFGVCRTTERRDDVLKRVNVDVTSCDDMTFD